MKKRMVMICLVSLCLFLAACGAKNGVSYTTWDCEHEFKDATCTSPRTCRFCGIKEGDALGHSWDDATCVYPKRCSGCRLIDGEPKPHNYVDHFCQDCGKILASEGLEFYYDPIKGEYYLNGLGTCTDSVIYVPDTYLGYAVTGISGNTFSGEHGVNTIWISENIKEIPRLHGLENIYVVEENPNFEDRDGVLFQKGMHALVQFPEARGGSYVVPSSVDQIQKNAFLNCTNLESVTIQDGVAEMKQSCFRGCTSLREVTISGTVGSIGQFAFADCTALEVVTFQETTRNGFELYMDSDVFVNCTSLHTVTLPSHIAWLGDRCFVECTSLQSIVLPALVTVIPEDCFFNCSSLETVTFSEGLIKVESSAFEYCASLREIVFPDTTVAIEDYAFSGCTALERVVLPAALRVLNERVFSDCVSLREVVFNDVLEKISSRAFSNCYALSDIDLPESLLEIENEAFFSTRLKTIALPENLQSFAAYVFEGNVQMQYNHYDHALYLGNQRNPYMVLVRASTTEISSCTIHPDTVVIAAGAFGNCDQLTAITVPTGVRYLCNSAFQNCLELSQVTLEFSDIDDQLELGALVFYNCLSLTELHFGGCYESWRTRVIRDSKWNEGSRIETVITSDATTAP